MSDITFCFIFNVQLLCIFFELSKYHKIIKIQNGHLTAILNCLLSKANQVIGWYSWLYFPKNIDKKINQIKRSDWNFFLKHANAFFFVSGHSHQKSNGYVKYEEAEVHRSAIIQDFRDNEKTNFGFYNCEICPGLSLCETSHFVLYAWSSYFAFFKISQNNKNSK